MVATTVDRTNYATEPRPQDGGPSLNSVLWQHTLATTSIDEAADGVNLGYLTTGNTLLGFFVHCEDVDAGVGFVWKLTVGATDVHTAITMGQTASDITPTGTQFIGIKPIVISGPTLVKFVVTTAATTPAAGVLTICPVLIAN